ncbi:MAG: hypothetical protein LBU03_00620 [Tannerellaceae bacterium]|jgi:hypothetical protein|nr:hypothetical protein [Tannerellaceae bacterium]
MEQEYSKETLDILGKIPNRFVRYGSSIFFLILTGTLTGLCFIHYSDTFETSVIIREREYFNHTAYRDSADKYIAYIQINSLDNWKIKINSKVVISLKQYPKNIYGILFGNIVQITYNNKNQLYDVYIQLSNGLTTSFDKNLEYIPDMSGKAIIKGEDRNIFKRVFSSVLSEN